MNNNLVIFYNDGSKDVFSFDVDTIESVALKRFQSMRPNVKGTDVAKYFYFTNDDTPPNTYGMYGKLAEEKDNQMMKIDYRAMLINKKVEGVRKKRDAFLNKLDIPFMRSLEDEDTRVKNHIIELKDFLRDVPSELNFDKLTDEQILTYNPFGNIFEIIIIDGGNGYTEPPKITIDGPKAPNVSATATAFVNSGKVSKVKINNYGCGYDYIPQVTIDAPKEGLEAIAVCGLPQNIFLTSEELQENTKKLYVR